MEKAILVKVIHAYTPVNNDELKLEKGDVITVSQNDDEGWWEGSLNGRTGWFPSNYVTIFQDEDIPVASPRKKSHGHFSPLKKRSSTAHSSHSSSPAQISQAIPSTTDSNDALQYRRLILKELIESEEKYIKLLDEIHSKLFQQLPFLGSSVFSTEFHDLVNSPIQELTDAHTSQLLLPIISEQNKVLKEQRIGKIFLDAASRIESSQKAYSQVHPKLINLIETAKKEASDNLTTDEYLNVVTMFSNPFRHFEKYPSYLQQLCTSVEDAHKDRGNLQRSIEYYKEIDRICGELRRQKEMELQILNGSIIGWEGTEISLLGEIVHMSLVHVGQELLPRYFVLFNSCLLLLSYNSEENTFQYEGKIPVNGISLPPASLERNRQTISSCSFEIAGPLIEPILVTCASKQVKEGWLNELNRVLRVHRFPSSCNPAVTSATNHTSPSTQSYGQISPPVEAWSISRLRPTPPINPFLIIDSNNGRSTGMSGSSSNGSSKGNTPSKGTLHHDNTSTNPLGGLRFPSQLSNEEELTILSIVDSFCSKNRQTSTGLLQQQQGQHQSKVTRSRVPRTLAELVYTIRDEIGTLSSTMEKFKKQLDEEQRERKAIGAFLYDFHQTWKNQNNSQ